MTEHTRDQNPTDRQTGDRSQKGDASNRQPSKTGAGQEATKGKAPEQHDDERQSNYGGGGANGGTAGR